MAFFVVLASAWVLGGVALRRLGLRDSVAGVMLRLYAGLCLCAVLSMIVGSFSLRSVQVIFYIVALLGLGVEQFSRSRRHEPLPRPIFRRPLTRFEKACLTALAGSFLLTLISALAPVTSWDATVAHLALPQAYAMQGCIGLLEGNAYSGYPHFIHSLFAYVYLESGEAAVSLLNWGFAVLACSAMYALGNRLCGRTCGLIAATIFATAPVYMDQAAGASLDLAFAGLSVAALYSFIAWYEEERPSWLFLAAFLAGSSCGVRHTGYLVCVLLALGVFAASSPSREEAVKWFGAVAFLGALPWLARSALLTCNPVYPFFS
ncbi:MAG TPA: hypothetical protein ENN80_03820, partial [Candidatus Hydrogenedentes bacterium]|nr:hypothetical protein [Candidatus Hydrogenedentota bacterium]